MSFVFFLLAAFGLLATVLALFRVRHPSQFGFFILMLAWPTGEWALFHIAWQAVVTAIFVALGALDEGWGQAGLAMTLVSWCGLVMVAMIARRARPARDAAFVETLGSDWAGEIPEQVRSGFRTAPPGGLERLPIHYDRSGLAIDHDIAYGPHPKRNLLDVYRPTGERATGAAPVILQVHGGAWVIGNKQQQGQPLLHHMARQGFVGVSINYRLSPRAKFPDHLIDVKRAISWIRTNIADYGGDPDTVMITGGSAGGHLTLLTALTPNDLRYQPGFEEVDTSVVAAVPFYPPTDFLDRERIRGYASLEPMLSRVVMPGGPADEPDLWAMASPIELVRPDAPPMLIVQGQNDVLVYREETQLFVDELRKVSEQPVVYWEVPGAQHAFDTFNSLRSAVAVDAVDRFCRYVLAVRTTTP